MNVKLASIHFAPLRAERSAYHAKYEIPAVPKGSAPAIIQLTDKVQHEQGSWTSGGGNQRGNTSHLIAGEAIANDLVHEWARQGLGMNDKSHPGVWMVREHIQAIGEENEPLADAMGATIWRAATKEEKDAMWAEDLAANIEADKNYSDYLITEADGLMMRDIRLRRFIPDKAKLACQQYGIDREWLRTTTVANVGPCPYCKTTINLDAIKCPKCTEVVNIEKYAELKAMEGEAIARKKKELSQLPPAPIRTGGFGLKPETVSA